jgi:uncharacterized protein (TIGR03435 family)
MHRFPLRPAAAALVWGAIVLARGPAVEACTAFCAASGAQVLVGNNEDYDAPRTKIWFIPARPGSYGRVYTGFPDLTPQGGMNERGLWFDGFSAPPINGTGPADLPRYPGNIVDAAMAGCATVEEVVQLFEQYDRSFLAEAILMFADASGDAVSIERSAVVRKSGRHFVQTNFHQSLARRGDRDGRFATASSMLERAGGDISIDLFRRILAATHQKGAYPTLYSNVYDLRSRTMHLYYFHDFERAVTLRLDDELKKGERVLDISSLFPRSDAAEAFAARNAPQAGPGRATAIAVTLVPLLLVAIAVYGWIRWGRPFRVGLAAVGGTIAVLVAAVVAIVETHEQASRQWIAFSIAPSSGDSVQIGQTSVRASGITLKGAIALAHDMPRVRVIGPPWLAETRYAMTAVAGIDGPENFQALLRQELKNRMRLETHVEVRPFDVFVLTTKGMPRLERGHAGGPSIRVGRRGVQFQNATMAHVASALQNILERPVIDETRAEGAFTFDFEWGDDRTASITAVLRDRFGLELSSGRRDMEALVVDSIRRDASLVLLEQAGRLTRGVPPDLRRRLSSLLTVH